MANAPILDDLTGIATVNITSSTILTATATNKWLVVGEGVYIEDFIIETDSTGLAGGTLFQVKKTDTKGATIIASHAVASLGANVTVDGSTATTKNRAICTSGTYITVSSTAADCTGAGVVRVTLKFRRVNPNSTLQAV